MKKQKPVITGAWKTICTMPNLGELQNLKGKEVQNIVDHGFYQHEDGTWHLWAAIRNAKNGHPICAWDGKSLEQENWEYKGVVLRANPKYGELIKENGEELVCAPFFIKHENQWNCFYNSNGIHRLISKDGKNFKRVLNNEGLSLSHSGGRDAMLLKIKDTYFAYSCVTTCSVDNWLKGFVIVRTSKDLETWSDYTIVSEGGRGGNGPVAAESPFVVFKDGFYYLFRASSISFTTFVYCSDTPYHFGINEDSKLIAELPVKAPEIVFHNNQYYISDLADFQSIKISKMEWL